MKKKIIAFVVVVALTVAMLPMSSVLAQFEPFAVTIDFNGGLLGDDDIEKLKAAGFEVAGDCYKKEYTESVQADTIRGLLDTLTIDPPENKDLVSFIAIPPAECIEGDTKFTADWSYDIYDCTIASIPRQQYTGQAITPSITVTDGEKVLVENTDYTVEFENNVNIGTAQVAITGIGDYDGITGTQFEIVNFITGVTKTNSHYPIYGQTLAQYKAAGNPPTMTANPVNSVVDNVGVVYKKDSDNQWTVMADTDVFKKGVSYKVSNTLSAADTYSFDTANFMLVIDGTSYNVTVSDDGKSVSYEFPLTVKESSVPKTGDETNVAMMIGLIAMAAVAVVVCGFRCRKQH